MASRSRTPRRALLHWRQAASAGLASTPAKASAALPARREAACTLHNDDQIRKFARPRVGLAGDGIGTRRLPSRVAQAQLHSPKEERLIIADPQAGLDKLLKKRPS